MIGSRWMMIACVAVAVSTEARADKASANVRDLELHTKIGAAIHEGDPWDTAVRNVVAAIGQPAVATADHIQWAVLSDGHCFHVDATTVGDGFVETTLARGVFRNAEWFDECKKIAKMHAKVPAKLKGPPQVDVDGAARAVMEQLRDGKFEDLFASAHPLFRMTVGSAEVLARMSNLYSSRAGKFVKLGSPLDHEIKDHGWTASGPAIYEKGTLRVSLSFMRVGGGKLGLSNINLKLPKALQANPDPKAAAASARAALDRLLAGKVGEFRGSMSWQLAKKLDASPDFGAQLKDLLTKIGKVRSIKQTDQHECNGGQCFIFELKAAGGITHATFTMEFDVSEWAIHEFNVDPPAP